MNACDESAPVRQTAIALAEVNGHALGPWTALDTHRGYSAVCVCGRMALVEHERGRWLWSGGATYRRCRIVPPSTTREECGRARLMGAVADVIARRPPHKILTAGDSANPFGALNTHGQTGSEATSADTSGPANREAVAKTVRAIRQVAERPAVRKPFRQVLPSVYVPPKGSIAYSFLGTVIR